MSENIVNMSRQSNMELARIVAMFLVLVGHADFLSLGWPSYEDSVNAPSDTWFRLFVESASLVSVNLFVFISGWFGIHPSVKKAVHLLFVALFYSLTIFCISLAVNGSDACTLDNIKNAVLLSQGYWFIKCYLFLFIISPALNLLVEHLPKKQVLILIIGLFVFQTVFGWSEATFDYHHGYSSLLFILLYLIARFAREYDFRHKCDKNFWLSVYVLLTIIITVISFVATRIEWIPSSIVWYMMNYLNPLAVFSAFSLLLYFSNLKIKSNRFINWVASSTLAVYLIHANDVTLPLYAEAIYRINSNSHIPLVMINVFIISVFVACILIDKVRALLFRIIRIG